MVKLPEQCPSRHKTSCPSSILIIQLSVSFLYNCIFSYSCCPSFIDLNNCFMAWIWHNFGYVRLEIFVQEFYHELYNNTVIPLHGEHVCFSCLRLIYSWYPWVLPMRNPLIFFYDKICIEILKILYLNHSVCVQLFPVRMQKSIVVQPLVQILH